MKNAVVTIVSDTVADMIEVSTKDGQLLESGPAESLLQASVCNNIGDGYRSHFSLAVASRSPYRCCSFVHFRGCRARHRCSPERVEGWSMPPVYSNLLHPTITI